MIAEAEITKTDRRDMLSRMATLTQSPSSMVPEEQERVAKFMVDSLRGLGD